MSRPPASLSGLAIIPLALLVHNAEEALTVANALPRVSVAATRILGRPIELPSPSQYYDALALVTALGFASYGWARLWGPAAYALVVLQAVMALNVLTHTASAILLGGYAPGIITAWAVEAPTCWVVYRRVREGNWMAAWQWRMLAPLVLVIHGPLLVGFLRLVREL